ncbi:MAG: hypothetical protein U9Q07_04235 [Planctomycetota bacterium]|nr:hypothetical protein [Planctomycetota bacterium]
MGKELNSGFMRGQKALTNMSKSMGRMIRQAGTIGAAFATGALVRDSIEIHKSFQDISFLVSKLPGQQMKVAEVQTLVTDAANRTTRTTKEMAGAFRQVYVATGDLDYAKESLDMIGRAATASGAPIEQIAQVSEMVRRKWKVTGQAAEEMMTAFIAKADKGGLSLDQLSTRLDAVAGEAAELGLDASALLGTISQLDSVMGAMAARGLKTFLQYIKEGATQTMRLEKAGKFTFDPNMDALDRIRTIIKSPAAHKEALTVFTETSRTAFDELRKPFVLAMEEAREGGATYQEAQKAGLEAYDKMVKQIRKTEMSATDIDRMYKRRVETDPSVKLRLALNKIRDAFAQPKMIAAITKLADSLPALAKGVADMVSFVVDNPLGAAGMGMGMRVGLPMLMGGGLQQGMGMGRGGMAGVGGARGGLAGVGTSARTASGQIGTMGSRAMGVAGSLAGIAALGYGLGKVAESYIESEGKNLELAEKLRQEVYDLRAGAQGKSIKEQIVALEETTKKKEVARGEMTRDRSVMETLSGWAGMAQGEDFATASGWTAMKGTFESIAQQEKEQMTALQNRIREEGLASEKFKEGVGVTVDQIIKFGKAVETAQGSISSTGGTKPKTDPRSYRDRADRGIVLKGVPNPGASPLDVFLVRK